MNTPASWYNARETADLLAVAETVKKLGKGHPMTKMFGVLAWGRHEADGGGSRGQLRPAIRAASFVEGYLDCVILWSRDACPDAQRILLAERDEARAAVQR